MEKIDEKYYLGSNKTTFILYEKKITSTGKENFKNVGYFSSLDGLYKSLLEKEIREDISLVQNIKYIDERINELKEFTKKFDCNNK